MTVIIEQPVACDQRTMVSAEIHSLKDKEYLIFLHGEIFYIIVLVIDMA